MTERKYEPSLYRRYSAGGDPWDLPEGQTHHYEYDRDPAAERAVAAWEAVRHWLYSYGITAKTLRSWTSDPLAITRLTSQASEALYDALADALKREEDGDAVQTD